MQHAGARWKGNQGLMTHLYLILEDVGLSVVDVFAYRDLMQLDVQNKREVVLVDVDLLYLFDQKEGVDDNVSRNRTSVEMTAEEDE